MTQRLSRRQALGAFGTISLGGLLAACGGSDERAAAGTTARTTEGATTTVQPRTAVPGATAALFDDAASCTVTPQDAEGPFYFDADAVRSDIRENRPGALLRLALRVRDAGACEPIPSAVVDIWHADADGDYSGVDGADGTRYLRGAQVTDAAGIVEFRTIYPGWYPGRAVHVHAKVHLDARTVLTTQLYFDDALTDAVFEDRPYSSRGARDQRNDGDRLFDRRLVLTATQDGDGYRAIMTLDVQRS
ncbi:MAG: intradiol ring-cleavage dioxygenase [Solirubrobacteraceae bacterium]|nr:intradiol ring-cleavage dioxygenase [Solirubrobacteraceae bacterium]